jgi:hypothetical protein
LRGKAFEAVDVGVASRWGVDMRHDLVVLEEAAFSLHVVIALVLPGYVIHGESAVRV